MKKLTALVLVLVVGYVLLTGMYQIKPYSEFTNANLSERVSESYIKKNVNSEQIDYEFGVTNGLESSSANIVTSIVVDYRSFDTLGEVTVLFVSALGVGYFLSGSKKKRKYGYKANNVLKTITPILFPIILTLGVNIFAHGHLTPGGGFPGGAIIASGVLLLLLSDEKYAINAKLFKAQESLAGSGYVVAGLIGLATSGYFLQNFLPTGVIGELFSAGIIPIVYILIGIKVGTEVSSVVNDFFTEGDQ